MRLPEFLQQKLQPKEGVIIEIPAEAEIYNQENRISIRKKKLLLLNREELII